MHLFDKPCERLPTKTIDSLSERAHFFTGGGSLEMAVMEQLGNVLEDGKRIFLGPYRRMSNRAK